ncbi:TIGR02450 family Trp-rich protein [Cocleimonas sp. KMM 6892]|jgi:tryptophan-rich hypothetical protein|uniref:TIGR02450 family Trp-rich protein n=1 Tax=unclassified Cocleimonas TaxID=2639732 RepID=UPI002DBE98F5|nr:MULTISPECIES: TIGR02450 family Trp-rich protein [unclassified Cocleimonas]MEB8431579.1 TIGR02450 family Trp-rich protein [Cocleimonas sp. KMM 6892]MEC4713649.1 TIGR02450 family Trp-rich protein [Cocleimonas sp. KMM 6895]MEC4742980.1 TIGR02450 family Trp-rich protein [Cocleimonas sp. KMM 6896]
MNQINPKKLLLSKWTATAPVNKERHFIVSELIKDEEEKIIGCKLEAVINKNLYEIQWQRLKNNEEWLMGWK